MIIQYLKKNDLVVCVLNTIRCKLYYNIIKDYTYNLSSESPRVEMKKTFIYFYLLYI